MEIQKREIEIHKYRYPSAVFWCWLPGWCLLTKSAKLPILLLISPCDLHRHHDKDFGNIMLTIVTLEGKIINMYSSENKLAKLWQMQPNWYPSSQQPIIYIFVFLSIFLITQSHMLILYNLMKQSSSIYPGSCWATPGLRQVEGRRPREPSSCLQWKSCSQSPQDLNHDQVAWRCPLKLFLQGQSRKPTDWLQVATRLNESGP